MTQKAKSAKPSTSAPKIAAKTSKAPASKTPADKAAPEIEKLTKGHLVDLISERNSMSKKEAGEAFDAVIGVMISAFKGGQAVGLPGLGTFTVRATAARQGVRPGTSEKIQIPAGKKLGFKVASDLKKVL